MDQLQLLLLVTGAAVCSGLVLLALLVLLLRRRGSQDAAESQDDLTIDLLSLNAEKPPTDGPRLEFYGTPVRLVVLILAPAGRGTAMPSAVQLRDVVDRLVANLSKILDWHQPTYQQWPQQLSTHGFAQSFFNNVQLPGDRGRGTPWCSLAGRISFSSGQLLAGLVLRGDSENGLGQVVVEHEGQWNDILRVKEN